MADKAKKPEHSKLADIERLRLMRYNTKGPGAKRARPAPVTTVDQLRAKVAKVATKKKPKKGRRR